MVLEETDSDRVSAVIYRSVATSQKISGPLLDRIDLQVNIERPSDAVLLSDSREQSSASIRSRVEAARQIQIERQGCANADLRGSELENAIPLSKPIKHFLANIMQKLQLSPRGVHRMIRVARTIADLRGSATLEESDVLEVVSYRQ